MFKVPVDIQLTEDVKIKADVKVETVIENILNKYNSDIILRDLDNEDIFNWACEASYGYQYDTMWEWFPEEKQEELAATFFNVEDLEHKSKTLDRLCKAIEEKDQHLIDLLVHEVNLTKKD
jgi:hypothetical protein